MIKIGDPYTFIPNGFVKYKEDGMSLPKSVPVEITGTIVGINRKTRCFRVEAPIYNGEYLIHETFKLS